MGVTADGDFQSYFTPFNQLNWQLLEKSDTNLSDSDIERITFSQRGGTNPVGIAIESGDFSFNIRKDGGAKLQKAGNSSSIF